MSDLVRDLLFRASDQNGVGWTPTTVVPVPAGLLHRAADEIERMRAALEWINQQRYTGRNTINPDNAFEHAISLNEKLIAVMDIARAALAEENKDDR
jgi:hypothetical protein